MIRQLLDIRHHAIQLPLPIHLGFSAQRKAIQTLIAAQVAKHRLHCCKAARDHLSACIGIDFLFHPFDMILTGIAFSLKERNLTGLGLFWCAQTCLVDVESDPIYSLCDPIYSLWMSSLTPFIPHLFPTPFIPCGCRV